MLKTANTKPYESIKKLLYELVLACFLLFIFKMDKIDRLLKKWFMSECSGKCDYKTHTKVIDYNDVEMLKSLFKKHKDEIQN